MSTPVKDVWLVGFVHTWDAIKVRSPIGVESPIASPADGSLGFIVAFDSKEAAVEYADGSPVWSVSRLSGEG